MTARHPPPWHPPAGSDGHLPPQNAIGGGALLFLTKLASADGTGREMSTLICVVMAFVPRLVVPAWHLAPSRVHRHSAAALIATTAASSLEATAVQPANSLVQLLTTHPESMLAMLNATAAQNQGIWAALRKGLDPLEDPVFESPVGLQLNSRHVSVRTQSQLRAACAPLRAGSVTAESHSDSAGTQKLLLELHDGLAVECVLIPMGRHTSVCVSSQARRSSPPPLPP